MNVKFHSLSICYTYKITFVATVCFKKLLNNLRPARSDVRCYKMFTKRIELTLCWLREGLIMIAWVWIQVKCYLLPVHHWKPSLFRHQCGDKNSITHFLLVMGWNVMRLHCKEKDAVSLTACCWSWDEMQWDCMVKKKKTLSLTACWLWDEM